MIMAPRSAAGTGFFGGDALVHDEQSPSGNFGQEQRDGSHQQPGQKPAMSAQTRRIGEDFEHVDPLPAHGQHDRWLEEYLHPPEKPDTVAWVRENKGASLPDRGSRAAAH